jgi:hypothetical protein
MTRSHRRLAALVATGCALPASAGALAAPASAATISVDKACYVNTATGPAPLTVTGSGFDPGESIQIAGGTTVIDTTADATGSFTATGSAPVLNTKGAGTRWTTLTASGFDANTGTTTSASTRALSANLAVSTKPLSVPVNELRKRKVTFSFSGFTPGKDIYGYYLRKRVVAKTRFGKATGRCGTLKQKALLLPPGLSTTVRYSLVFESVPHYSKSAFPRVTALVQFLTL